MSRRKYQTAKLLKNYFRAGQFWLCDLGEVFAYDSDTADLISDIQAIEAGPPLDLCKTATQRRNMLKELERGRTEVGARLTKLFVEAIGTENLDRVKRLLSATAMASQGPVSPKYIWLWAYLGTHAMHPDKMWNTPPPWRARVTFSQVRQEYEARFDAVDDWQLREMIIALGWRLAPDRPGPKVTQNSP